MPPYGRSFKGSAAAFEQGHILTNYASNFKKRSIKASLRLSFETYHVQNRRTELRRKTPNTSNHHTAYLSGFKNGLTFTSNKTYHEAKRNITLQWFKKLYGCNFGIIKSTRYYILKFQKKAYYRYFLHRKFMKDYQKFATNPHLKQGDIIFFSNPDRTPALVSQARRLRLPTIGLVSGLKSSQAVGYHNHHAQKDSVDMPILGNPSGGFSNPSGKGPDKSFFVLMI